MKKIIKSVLMAVPIILIFSIAIIFLKKSEAKELKIEFYAHRGYRSEYPENTLESFEGAMTAGFEGIEIDVFETKSGEILVFHDDTTDRMCGISDSIYNISNENREKYPIITGNNIEKYDSLLIPTLEETVAAMQKRNAGLFIHIKGMKNITNEGIKKIDEILRKYDMVDNSIIFCSKSKLMKKFEAKGLNIAINMTTKSKKTAMELVEVCIKENIKTFIIFYPKNVNQEVVDKCHENGIRLGVYKVKKKKEVRRLDRLGVDFLFSDFALFHEL